MLSIRRVIGIAILLVIILALGVLVFRFWYQPTYDYVEVTDAQVTGDLTQLAAPASGQVMALFFAKGDTVNAGDTIATIKVVSAAPSSVASAPSIPRLLTRVTTPVTGRIAARPVSLGDTVAPGQVLMSIVDLSNLWVEADVDEGRIGQIAHSQPVDISIEALGKPLKGQVAEIGSATTEITSPGIASFGTSDSTKKIPVRIQVDWGAVQGVSPLPGMTADVVIHIK
jgi:multidrug resistance efflux pump